MRINKRVLIAAGSLVAIFAVIVAAFAVSHRPAAAAGPSNTSLANLTIVGDTSIGAGSVGSNTSTKNDQVRPETDHSPQVPNKSVKNLPAPPTTNPNPAGRQVTSSNPGATGFEGLSHADQRNVGAGIYTNTQFSLEPPDQGLCVGGDYVMESVNNALAVYSKSGKVLSGPTPNSQFYNLAPEINRVTGVAGPFISDPKCLYDTQTNRWYMTELEQDSGKNPGATGRNYQLIAVSQSGDPTGKWTIFKFDTTDDGAAGTPNNPGCPCFGDQPLIGADNFGFYITTNEFGAGFNGSQVYAVSKWLLAQAASHSGSLPTVVHINAGPGLLPYGGTSYSLQPAVRSPFDFNYDDFKNQFSQHGIEYFLSALQFGNPGYEVLDDRIATWALTNTSSLGSHTPSLSLSFKVIGSETYGQPNNMSQKPGPTPLATSLGEPLEQIQSNDDRMNQVVFANNTLYGAVNTLVGDGTRTGIAYFEVQPSWSSSTLNAHMTHQGYVAVNGNNVAYPSIAVTAYGQGIIAFTLVGPNYYPSAAYVTVGDRDDSSKIHVIGAGTLPDDGFTAYPQYGGTGAARWGDYSAAVATFDGIWAADEYITNAPPRTLLANWDTFVYHVSSDFFGSN